jgi:hypothetical protein
MERVCCIVSCLIELVAGGASEVTYGFLGIGDLPA